MFGFGKKNKQFSATIFMKSGNEIHIDKVENIEIKWNDHKITFLLIKQSKKAVNWLFVESIALDQIEVIVKHN